MWWLFTLSRRCYLPFYFFICSKGKDCLQVCFLVNHKFFIKIAWYISNMWAQRSPGEWVTGLFLNYIHRNLRCNYTILIRWWSPFFVKVLLSHSLSSSKLTSYKIHLKAFKTYFIFRTRWNFEELLFAFRLVPLLFSTRYGSTWRCFESCVVWPVTLIIIPLLFNLSRIHILSWAFYIPGCFVIIDTVLDQTIER